MVPTQGERPLPLWRSTRLSTLFASLFTFATLATFAALGLLACGADPGDPSGGRLDPTVLASELDDPDEIAAYLEAFPAEEYEVVDVPGLGRFYLDDNPALVKKSLRAGKRWEPDVQAVMQRHIRPGSLVLDIGAHIGSHTLALADFVGPNGVVYAFEPQRKIYRELVKNLELNAILNVVPLRFAVGERHDVIEMMSVGGRDGGARIGKRGEPAELRTIDSFGFRDVSLIKIDVEQYEKPVLEGARETIAASQPAIVVEILGANKYRELPPAQRASIDQTRHLIDDLGYEIQLISCYGGCDFLALPRGRQRAP